LPVWSDLVKVLRIAVSVDRRRKLLGPAALVGELRILGATRPARDFAARAQLRRAIALVDRLFPSGPNCYRRALVEIALDAGAAAEPLRMGIRKDGAPKSGHAWLPSWPERQERYDAEFFV
jgi:hypothetical protein